MAVQEQIVITPYDTPWEVACMLINAEHKFENLFEQTSVSTFFDKRDLRCIGEHLIGYCNAEREASE